MGENIYLLSYFWGNSEFLMGQISVFFSPSSQLLWCSQTGDHPQEDLAKFGYRPDVEVEKI